MGDFKTLSETSEMGAGVSKKSGLWPWFVPIIVEGNPRFSRRCTVRRTIVKVLKDIQSSIVYNIQHSVIQTDKVQHNRNNQLREISPVHQHIILHRGAGGGEVEVINSKSFL